jgi:hypothetical protein
VRRSLQLHHDRQEQDQDAARRSVGKWQDAEGITELDLEMAAKLASREVRC